MKSQMLTVNIEKRAEGSLTLVPAVPAWRCAQSQCCWRHRGREHPGWRTESECWHTWTHMHTHTCTHRMVSVVSLSRLHSAGWADVEELFYLFMPLRNSNRRRPSGMENTRMTVPCAEPPSLWFTRTFSSHMNSVPEQTWGESLSYPLWRAGKFGGWGVEGQSCQRSVVGRDHCHCALKAQHPQLTLEAILTALQAQVELWGWRDVGLPALNHTFDSKLSAEWAWTLS